MNIDERRTRPGLNDTVKLADNYFLLARRNRHSDRRPNRETATDPFPIIVPPRLLYAFD